MNDQIQQKLLKRIKIIFVKFLAQKYDDKKSKDIFKFVFGIKSDVKLNYIDQEMEEIVLIKTLKIINDSQQGIIEEDHKNHFDEINKRQNNLDNIHNLNQQYKTKFHNDNLNQNSLEIKNEFYKIEINNKNDKVKENNENDIENIQENDEQVSDDQEQNDIRIIQKSKIHQKILSSITKNQNQKRDGLPHFNRGCIVEQINAIYPDKKSFTQFIEYISNEKYYQDFTLKYIKNLFLGFKDPDKKISFVKHIEKDYVRIHIPLKSEPNSMSSSKFLIEFAEQLVSEIGQNNSSINSGAKSFEESYSKLLKLHSESDQISKWIEFEEKFYTENNGCKVTFPIEHIGFQLNIAKYLNDDRHPNSSTLNTYDDDINVRMHQVDTQTHPLVDLNPNITQNLSGKKTICLEGNSCFRVPICPSFVPFYKGILDYRSEYPAVPGAAAKNYISARKPIRMNGQKQEKVYKEWIQVSMQNDNDVQKHYLRTSEDGRFNSFKWANTLQQYFLQEQNELKTKYVTFEKLNHRNKAKEKAIDAYCIYKNYSQPVNKLCTVFQHINIMFDLYGFSSEIKDFYFYLVTKVFIVNLLGQTRKIEKQFKPNDLFINIFKSTIKQVNQTIQIFEEFINRIYNFVAIFTDDNEHTWHNQKDPRYSMKQQDNHYALKRIQQLLHFDNSTEKYNFKNVDMGITFIQGYWGKDVLGLVSCELLVQQIMVTLNFKTDYVHEQAYIFFTKDAYQFENDLLKDKIILLKNNICAIFSRTCGKKLFGISNNMKITKI